MNLKKKKIKKNIHNKKFDESTYFSPSLNEIFNTHMILCLNKKNKLKTQHERECISSIQHGFRLDSKNNLKISIDSKTPAQYEGKRYNKILRLFTILIIYYLNKNYKLFTKYKDRIKDRIINDIYIESQAINPISALLSLQIGFMAVNANDNIDKDLTERLKSMTVKELQVEMANIQPFEPTIYTRYYINTMSEDNVMNIKQQITNLIIGKTHNNTKILKCLDNKNNTIKNITNVNRNRNRNSLLANNNPELIYNSSNLEETARESAYNSSNNKSGVTHNSKLTNSSHTNSENNKSMY